MILVLQTVVAILVGLPAVALVFAGARSIVAAIRCEMRNVDAAPVDRDLTIKFVVGLAFWLAAGVLLVLARVLVGIAA